MHEITLRPCEESFSFGPYLLRPAARRLEKNNVKMPLGDRAFDLLVILVRLAGTVVPKRELIEHAWRNITVDEGSLRVRLAELRRVFRVYDEDEAFIENVKGQGYCFVREVTSARPERPAPAPKPLTGFSVPHPEKWARPAALDIVDEEPGRNLGTEIEIELPNGYKLRMSSDVDEFRLKRIIAALPLNA